jgi:hypothetical protein
MKFTPSAARGVVLKIKVPEWSDMLFHIERIGKKIITQGHVHFLNAELMDKQLIRSMYLKNLLYASNREVRN